ncbi:ABC transporter substrate-binding protein [Gordonia sp. DT30]|uniref:ABC transporter substrate-binding protein n=1 Tax=unclassified Gordonia (in: high G+C Gram-positive bacteria) TaxID=2657482 RepID=UPI003CE8626B
MASFLLPRRLSTRVAVALISVVTAVSLAACSSGGDSGDSAASGNLKLQTSWIPLVQFGGSYLAEKHGFYKANGVNVDILPGGPEVDSMAALASGQADIAMGNADTVARANAQGADLVIIAAGFQKNPLAVLSTPDKPIRTPADMAGKKIGVPSNDEASQSAVLAHNHIPESSVTSVPVSFDIAPLVSGEVDGLWSFYAEQPVAYQEKTGKTPVTMLAADYGFDVYAQVYAVRRSTLQDAASRKSIEGFLKGEIQGWQAYVQNPAEAAEVTVNEYAKNGGLTVEEQTKQAQRQLDLLVTPDTKAHGLLWVSDDGINHNVSTLTELGVKGVSKSLFDTSLLHDIYQGRNTVS